MIDIIGNKRKVQTKDRNGKKKMAFPLAVVYVEMALDSGQTQ